MILTFQEAKKTIASACLFFGTIMVLSGAYAAFQVVNSSEYAAWQTVSSTLFGKFAANLTDHESRIGAMESAQIGKKITGTWGPASGNIPNNTWTYIWDSITLTPGSWIVYYATFYDNDGTPFTIHTYNHPYLSATTDISGQVSSGNLWSCSQDYCPISQTYQVSTTTTKTYYIIHLLNYYTGTYAHIRSGWGNFYAIKTN